MDTRLLNANQENDEYRFEGYWFIPSNDKCHSEIPGVLVFKAEDSCVLHLFRAFDETMGFTSYPIIHGKINDGSFVTVFDAVSSGIYGAPGRWQMKCEACDIWCSDEKLFNSKNDVKFNEFCFGINRLRNWDERNGFFPAEFHRRGNGERTAAIEYRTPPNILLYEDRYVNIELRYFCMGSGLAIMQKEAYIRDYPRIVISSKNGALKYYGEKQSIDYYYRMISTFMILLIGEKTFAYDMRGMNLHKHHMKKGRDIPFWVITRHHQRRAICNSSLKEDDSTLVDFPLKYLNHYLPGLCKRYRAKFDRVSVQIYKIQRFILLKDGLDLESMLSLIFACDGIATNLFAKESEAVHNKCKSQAQRKDDQALKDKAFDLCANDKEVCGWLTRATGFVRGPSLAMSLRGALESIMRTTKSLSNAVIRTNIIDYIKEVRQAGAHSLSNEANHIQADPQLLVYMTIYMFYILRIMMLYKCGFPRTYIRESLHRPHVPFNFYDEEISKRMASWTKFKRKK